MKRIGLIILVLLFCFSIINVCGEMPPTGTIKGIEMTKDQRQKLNIFFSNFSEAHIPNFTEKTLNDKILIEFGVRHNYINNYKLFKNNGYTATLSKTYVDNSAYKYFGKKVKTHQSVGDYKYSKDYYTLQEASGEVFKFSQIDKLVRLDINTYNAYITVYTASSGFTGNVHGTMEQWKAQGEDVEVTAKKLAKIKTVKEGKTIRYILLSYQDMK